VADVIVDAHQHLWDLEGGDYPWLGPHVAAIDRTFTPDEAEAELRAGGVTGSVLVQAADTLADTESMLAVATERPWVLGVVGWVPLVDPAATVRTLDRFAGEVRLKGVRHLMHDEPDADWVVQPNVLESLRVVAERGLTFDLIAVQPRHLEHAPTIAGAIPELRLVIDHLAKPPIAEAGWEPWAGLLAGAAEAPNVHSKISGLNTAADPTSWTAQDLLPYIEHAIEVFGADRLMFGSDWPVATLAGDYEQVLTATRVALAGRSADERADIFAGTATRFYGLELGGAT
jgi:L-fuconolactonase